jgi:hypothetical protein
MQQLKEAALKVDSGRIRPIRTCIVIYVEMLVGE